MDLFLSDVLDGAAASFDEAELWRAPALHANLAYHAAYREVLGFTAPRVDAADFEARRQLAGAAWDACSRQVAESLVARTHLRVLARAQDALARALDAYEHAVACLRAGGRAAARTLLARKLVDRHSGEQGAAQLARASDELADAMAAHGLLTAYARWLLKERDARQLQLLQAGAGAGAAAAAAGAGAREGAGVQGYYARCAEVSSAWAAPERGIISGWRLPLLAQPLPPMSALEALRLAITRDGYLWRRDAGRALLLNACAHPAPDVHRLGGQGFRHRTLDIRHPAAARFLLARVVPPALYARVLLLLPPDDNGADLAPSVCPVWVGERLADHARQCARARLWVSVDAAGPSTAPNWDAHPRDHWLPAVQTLSCPCPCPWAPTLYAAMIAAHLQVGDVGDPLDAPAKPATPAQGQRLLHQLVARYAAARRLGERVFDEVDCAGGEWGEVVAIDTRPNVWTVLAVLCALDNLDLSRGWGVTVFCSSGSAEFYRAHLLPHAPHARVAALQELDAGGVEQEAFDLEAYNALLKSEAFWRRLRSPRALMVQSDGLLLRPGLEALAERAGDPAFMGAPWADVAGNEEVRAAGNLVGNGGLSLRRVSVMRRVCATHADAAKRLYNQGLQPVPEDVFFAAALEPRERCPVDAGEQFSFEQRPPAPPRAPLGTHKPWPYMPAGVVATAFRAFVADATARPSFFRQA